MAFVQPSNQPTGFSFTTALAVEGITKHGYPVRALALLFLGDNATHVIINLPLYNQIQASDDWLQSNCFAPVIEQDLFYQIHNANHILTVQS